MQQEYEKTIYENEKQLRQQQQQLKQQNRRHQNEMRRLEREVYYTSPLRNIAMVVCLLIFLAFFAYLIFG